MNASFFSEAELDLARVEQLGIILTIIENSCNLQCCFPRNKVITKVLSQTQHFRSYYLSILNEPYLHDMEMRLKWQLSIKRTTTLHGIDSQDRIQMIKLQQLQHDSSVEKI